MKGHGTQGMQMQNVYWKGPEGHDDSLWFVRVHEE